MNILCMRYLTSSDVEDTFNCALAGQYQFLMIHFLVPCILIFRKVRVSFVHACVMLHMHNTDLRQINGRPQVPRQNLKINNKAVISYVIFIFLSQSHTLCQTMAAQKIIN